MRLTAVSAALMQAKAWEKTWTGMTGRSNYWSGFLH